MGKAGFAGLGVMGLPMAGHLAKSGREVMVWNRTPGKAGLVEGAIPAESPAQLAAECEVVFLCVSRTEDVRECLAAMAPHSAPGTLFVDHSTISPEAAKEIHAELAGLGRRFLDAPITGGSMGAIKGQLTIFCGGEKADFEDALPFMQAYAKRAELAGPAGSGQMMKMANQIAVGGALIGLCESLAFAAKAGLDLRQTRELLAGGAAGSWAFENYGPKILAEDWSPGFSIANQRKDFGYCREAAAALGARIPMTELCDALLAETEDPEWTTAALFTAYMKQE